MTARGHQTISQGGLRDPETLREHVLDVLDQLAVMADEAGQIELAKALWACWDQVKPATAESARAASEREPVWIDTPPRTRSAAGS